MSRPLRSFNSPSSQGDSVRLKAIQELESNLVFAQNRCGELKDQVRLVKSYYRQLQETRGSDSNVKWEEESNSVKSPRSLENIAKNELAILDGPEPERIERVKDEGFEEVLDFDKRLNAGPKEVVQIILSGMSQTLSCHEKQGERTDGFMQTDPEIEFKSKARRIKQTKNSNKKVTKKKESVDRNRAVDPEMDFGRAPLPFAKKQKNQKKAKRRYSSFNLSHKRRMSEIAMREPDSESKSVIVQATASQRGAPHSVSMTAISFSPVDNDTPRRESRRYRSTVASTTTTSYLLPTVASSMKRTYRPVRNEHGDAQRIPFIVGKSLSKSHNLGTKIQETLSLIKRSGSVLTPLPGLTRDELELRSILSMRRPSSSAIKTNLALSSSYRPTSREMNVSDKSLAVAKKSVEDANLENQQLKSVLINLHDEFSQMTKKYDALREQENNCPESNDLLSKLDKEINKKEIEITVIMRLYNEVNKLKTRLVALESLPSSYRSYQYASQPSLPKVRDFHKNASSENVNMSQILLRRIDRFQDKLKNYTPVMPF